MLFLIVQEHSEQNCPKGRGGPKSLYDENASGIKLKGVYGDYPNHIIYFVVEADKVESVYGFLEPGWKKSTSKIIPVSDKQVK